MLICQLSWILRVSLMYNLFYGSVFLLILPLGLLRLSFNCWIYCWMVFRFYWHTVSCILYTSQEKWHILSYNLYCLLILNVVVVYVSLQHIFTAFDLHGVHLPSFKAFKSFLILPFSKQSVPIISWMFISFKWCYCFIFLNFSIVFVYL